MNSRSPIQVTDPSAPGLVMSLEIPDTWTDASSDDELPTEVLAAFTDDRSLTAGFTTNVLLISQELPAADLESWQLRSRREQLASLPDLQILDDRVVSGSPLPTWYRSRVMTGSGPSTQLVREWSRVVADRALTLTITTVPTVDAEHAELLDAIADSWTTRTEEA